MGETAEVKKAAKKQDATLGRSTKVAIWTALIAAAGTFFTTGLPDIIRLFSSRPPLEQVQDMIADQADKLTNATNRNVETLHKQQQALEALDALLAMQREELAKLTGCVETVQDVMRDCCTRRAPTTRAKLNRKPTKTKAVGPPEPSAVMKIMVHDEDEEEVFQKVPQMDRPWQQEQVQMQEE